MNRSIVAAAVPALVAALIPAAAVLWIAFRAADAERARAAAEQLEERIAAAAMLERELELASFRAEELVRTLPPDTDHAKMKVLFRVEGSPFVEFLGPESPRAAVDALDAMAKIHCGDPEASIPSRIGETYSRPHLSYPGDGFEVSGCCLPNGEVGGYLVNADSVIRGATALLPPHLALARKADAERDADTRDMELQGRKMTIALRRSGARGVDVMAGPDLAFSVVPRDPVEAARLVASRGQHVIDLTAASLVVLVTLAVVMFVGKRRAQALAELRTDFVAAVSHELRTPLASIRLFAELLEAGAVEPAARAEVEQALAREVRRLGETLEHMLRFGAIERGKLVATLERVRLRSLLNDAAVRLRAAHPDQSVVVEVDPSLEANIDPALFAVAVDNLLANAARYAPEGGPYRASARQEGRHILVFVADRGPGLDRRAQRRIFLPFERADDRLSRATKGTGVGLALVRAIARAHGGDATVESSPGAGATFILRFPRG
jgi:two-component system phosphate regulon sensor histidine kinase PhoR